MVTDERANCWADLTAHKNQAKERVDRIAILVVTNLARNKTAPQGAADRSTEYFSESELEQIVHGFRSFGFYCDVFIGESDFIKWVEGGGPKHFPDRRVVIYSTAQTGTGAGRKSLIPAICALHGLQYVNSDPYTESLARHKFHTNAILRSLGLSTPKCWWYLPDRRWLDGSHPPPGTRVITKSTYESASIGIGPNALLEYDQSKDQRIADLSASIGQGVVVQEFIAGRECETPVVALDTHVALGPIGIAIDNRKKLGDQYLDFDRVYYDNYSFYDFDLESPDTAENIRSAAVRAASALGLGGFSRIDFRVADSGTAYITDVSTTPHLVDHSAYSFCFRDAGWSRADMLGLLVGTMLVGHDSIQN